MKIFQRLLQLSFLLLVISATQANASSVTLKVMVNNLAPSGGVSLTPVWVGFHDGSFDSYNGGEASSAALRSLAEDGDTAPISTAFSSTPGGVDGAVFGDNPPLIQPGTSGQAMFTIDNGSSNRYFSYASMVLASSDYFIANGNPLAHDISSLLNGSASEISFFIGLPGTVNDAGTEVNDFETSAGNGLFPDLPAGQTAAGQGADENGVITNVDDPYTHFLNPPAGFDLSALDFNSYPNGIAKITVSAVPIPAALPLAATGFSLLFGMARFRQKKDLV
jgi:hypothetical protein